MDDLKLYAKDDKELSELLSIVKAFSDTIQMKFNASKCAKLSIKRGKYCSSENIILDEETTIRELDQHDTYKYLGISENAGISHKVMKGKVKKEYYRRVRMVMKSQLNSKHKFMAINSLAVPILIYSFVVINWTKAELKRLDTKTRKILTCNRAHHPKADVDRLYLKRSEGGRGLLQVEMTNKLTFIGIQTYLSKTQDWMMQCVKSHDSKKKRYSIATKTAEYKRELNFEEPKLESSTPPTIAAKVVKQVAKKAGLSQLQCNWRRKPLHGKFLQRSEEADVDRSSSFAWLKSSSLKAETEGFVLAAQDQSLKTKNYLAKVMKTQKDSRCRFCGQFDETIDHLVAGCPTLAISEYLTRHNKVAQYIHWKVCQFYGLPSNKNWYEHETPPVVENEKAAILWDFSIHTDRTINANRPDIIIRDKTNKTCILLDVSIPSDRNTSLKTYEKLSKYKDLEIELGKSWKMKMKTVPVIIGSLGVINKSATKYINEIPGNVQMYELQKIALLGTARILRKALSLHAV